MGKVKFGLSNVHIAPLTYNGSAYTYGKVIAIPGAVNLNLEASGDTSDFFADNIKYFSASANQGYEGDLEIAMLPDELRETIFGETKDQNGAYIESADDVIKPFAFGFQIEGDEKGRRFWYYNCTVSRPNNEASTVETSKEPATDSLSLKAMPRETDKKVRVLLPESATNAVAYSSFFETVYEEVHQA